MRIRQWHCVVVVLGVLLWGVAAHAEQVCRIIKFGQAPFALVARPGKLGEANTLLQAKENQEAAACCIACLPDVGTKVIITDRGFASHTIRVLDGTFKGCVGDVPVEWVGECK